MGNNICRLHTRSRVYFIPVSCTAPSREQYMLADMPRKQGNISYLLAAPLLVGQIYVWLDMLEEGNISRVSAALPRAKNYMSAGTPGAW